MLDHLVLATPDLDRTVDDVERRFGVRASPGGQHVGKGTRNALLSLGERTYLEIVGPDRTQPEPELPRWFGIDALEAPKLVTWAAQGRSLDAFRDRAAGEGIVLGDLIAGSRQRPDGVTLRWSNTSSRVMLGDGLVPFFIDWGASPHPAHTAAHGLTLLELRAEHPTAPDVTRTLGRLGIAMQVDDAPEPALIALLRGPNGDLELR